MPARPQASFTARPARPAPRGLRRGLVGTLGLAVLIVLGLAAGGHRAAGSTPAGPGVSEDHVMAGGRSSGLYVRGSRLLDDGRGVRLQGVNRSGTEYECIQGGGIFDGPSSARSVRAMRSWHVDVVRIPLNEDCWLGINGVRPQYAGASYRRAIVDYVRLLHRSGMYAELSLIWAAPGRYRATYQAAAPDETHAPAMWRSLAATFSHDHDIILAPWGETVVDARCFLRGGVCEATFGPRNRPYRVAGMQQAVDVMRRAGYGGVIAIPGIDYANDLSSWLRFEPRDPRHQLIAEAHVYGGNTCDTNACLNATMAPVVRRVPLLFGEFGESYQGTDCGTRHLATIVGWAEAHEVGLEAWTWDAWGNCSALISNYAGRPHGANGAWVRARYVARRATAAGYQLGALAWTRGG